MLGLVCKSVLLAAWSTVFACWAQAVRKFTFALLNLSGVDLEESHNPFSCRLSTQSLVQRLKCICSLARLHAQHHKARISVNCMYNKATY